MGWGDGEGWRARKEVEMKEKREGRKRMTKVETLLADMTIFFKDACDLRPQPTKSENTKCA